MKTTLVTVQLADKSAAATDAAVPMDAAKASISASKAYWRSATSIREIDAEQTMLKVRLLAFSAYLHEGNTMKPGLLTLCLLATLCFSVAATAGPAAKRRAWITIGDAAFRQWRAAAGGLSAKAAVDPTDFASAAA